MSQINSLFELESLFIEKLQEKFKLNKRDLKKAFSRFDLDNNGLLDLEELSKGIQLFLNGVKESQVQELVSCYDVNGDGKISYEEFLHFLMTRSAIQEDNYSETSSRPSSANSSQLSSNYGNRQPVKHYNNYVDDDMESYDEPPRQQSRQQAPPQNINKQMNRMTMNDERASIANRANQYLNQTAPQQRQPNRQYNQHPDNSSQDYDHPDNVSEAYPSSEVPSTMESGNPRELEYRAKVYLENLKTFLFKKAGEMRMAGKVKSSSTILKNSEMLETTARELMAKVFQPFTGQGTGRARDRDYQGIEYPDFARVLRGFTFPGTTPIRNEVVQFLFNLASINDDGTVFRNEEGRVVASHNVLIDLIFGVPIARQDRKERGLNKVGAKALEENSLTNEQEFDSGLQMKGFAQKMVAGRNVVGSGPVRLPNATDAKVERATESMVVPLRFVSRKSRTALAVPSSFDPSVSIRRSNQLPSYDLVRKHVFGVSTSTYSGNTLFVLPSTPSAFTSRYSAKKAGGRVTEQQYQQRNSVNFIDNATVVYASAGLGVIHNLAENTQLYFDDHKDDITCITVSTDGTLAATGCMGKRAVVHVWSTNLPLTDAKKSIATIGAGFFIRGVCSVEFSWDNAYIVCIGCDDQHMLGVFHIATGAKILEQSTQNGIPPMIKFLHYCPQQQYTEFISREHAGLCDIFATAGDHHIRLWSFKRPATPGDTTIGATSLTYKGLTIGKAATTAAKCYLCCGFIPCEDKTYDVVTGGSNGVVYLYRRGVLTVFAQVLRGKIQTLVVTGDRVCCGGAGGKLKILDGRTLTTLHDFSLLGNIAPAPATSTRPGSTAGRAKSAPRPSSRGGVVTAVKSNAPPTHSAGGVVRKNSGGNIISAENDAVVELEDASGARLVTGIAVVRGHGRAAAQSTYLLVSLGTGKVVRVDIGNAAGASTPRRPGSASYMQQAELPQYYGKDLFHFHTGAVYGLATDVTADRRLTVTVGDDKKLMVWDAQDCILLAKAVTQAPSRCVHIDKTNRFIAVGSTSGSVTVHYLTNQLDGTGQYFKVSELAYRKDAKAEITEMKFSPSNTKIAAGSRDDHIYIYSCQLDVQTSGNGRNVTETPTCVLRALHRLKGHSATITHIDWSIDSLLLQSTCGAYELLCWDVDTGRINTAVNAADVKWKTRHCTLGFSVMGIWPMYADGTDINALDVCPEKGVVATANDQGGLVKLFNYPCVVKNAPGKEYTGHSSHVTNVKFMSGGDLLASSGGNDSSVVLWDVVYDESLDNMDRFR